MTTEFITWPRTLLKPAKMLANPVAFTRGGGASLDGLSRSTRTDKGWWSLGYRGILLKDSNRRRSWNAVRTGVNGKAGLLVIPVWSNDALEWPANAHDGYIKVPYSDGTTHSDGTPFAQAIFDLQMAYTASIGDTSVTLRLDTKITDASGIRFSYNHALYETGYPTAVSGLLWTVPIFPAVRAEIPEDASLEAGLPTCLVRLATDRAMDAGYSASKLDPVDVDFVEATDYWNDLSLL